MPLVSNAANRDWLKSAHSWANLAAIYAQGSAVKPGASVADYTWHHSGGLNDVTSASNGTCATPVWCNAGTGWDGPTGLGAPNGFSAF